MFKKYILLKKYDLEIYLYMLLSFVYTTKHVKVSWTNYEMIGIRNRNKLNIYI